jgi:DNA-binding NtrC family response regulator
MLNGSQSGYAAQSGSRVSGDEDFTLIAPAAPAPFVGISSALRRLLLQAEIAIPRLQFATIEGEPGSGKHHFAQNLHHQSPSLAILPFRRRDARAWLASDAETSILSGTLYLDRVDLLAAPGQNLLLNLVKQLQSDAAPSGRFLLIASAQSSLRQLASKGCFLPDLAFRLTAVRFPLPPLREHREDIAPIAQTLIDRICRHYQQPTAVLSPGILPRLLQHNWAGNVRELASVLESAVLESTTGVLRATDLHLDTAVTSAPEPAVNGPNPPATTQALPDDLALDAVIRRHIQRVLDLNRGNKLRAARQLGISRSTLYRLLAGEASLAS